MADLDSALQGDERARERVRQEAGAALPPEADWAERKSAALSDIRQQAWRYPLGTILVSAAVVVAAFQMVTSSTASSSPMMLTLALTGLMAGPSGFGLGVLWLARVVRRREEVRARQWAAYPARSATVRYGPLRRTVVGLQISPRTTLVVYPEQWFRGRVRRLVEEEGQMLVLLPRPEKLTDRLLYAGRSGRPVFSEDRSLASDPQRHWEQRGADALAGSGSSAG